MKRIKAAFPCWTISSLVLIWPLSPLSAQGIFGISEKDEIEIGRQVAREIEKEQSVLQDREIANYVNSLGQTLVRHSSRSHLEYSFQVINSEKINAFALPGGFIYVNRGLMEAARTDLKPRKSSSLTCVHDPTPEIPW